MSKEIGEKIIELVDKKVELSQKTPSYIHLPKAKTLQQICTICHENIEKSHLKSEAICSPCYYRRRRERLRLEKKGEIKPKKPPTINITDEMLRTMPICEIMTLQMDKFFLRDVVKKRLDLEWKDATQTSQQELKQELEAVYEYLRLIGRLDEYLALAAGRAPPLSATP